MQSLSTKLSPLHLELPKVNSFHPSDEDLLAIRQYLANYFANKLVKQVDKAVEENDITDEKLKSWLNEKA